MREKLVIRFFVEVETHEQAATASAAVVEQLSGIAVHTTQNIERYWKIPEYFEVMLELYPCGDVEDCYPAVLRALGAGWVEQRKHESIWLPEGSNTFFLQTVRWAHVEVIQIRAQETS